MCDLNCVNLIDLSLEDAAPCSNPENKIKSDAILAARSLNFISSNCRQPDISENPFDKEQELVEQLYDPFDIVEKEAFLKAKQTYIESVHVKLGDLLSLNDDNLDKDKIRIPSSEELSDLKSLDIESPPVVFNDSTPKSSSEASNSSKLRKSMEYHKRLLKLTLSNTAYSSSSVWKQSLNYDEIRDSPTSTMFSKAAEFGAALSLSAESPLKLVQDEDILDAASNFLDSKHNFETDMEMLKIPILKNMSSPAIDQISVNSKDSPELVNNYPAHFENSLPNFEAIKSKSKANKEEIRNNLEILSLIQNLKTLISRGEMVDNKKQKASELLDSLCSSLKASNTEDMKTSQKLHLPTRIIKRQSTFDMDLQENLTNDDTNFDNQLLLQNMPNCMVSSSATYDNETPNEKQDFNLPEIDPLSPKTSPTPRCYQHQNISVCEENSHDVDSIMEQLRNILINMPGDNQVACPNPTLIVVMNTSNSNNHSNLCNYLESSADESATGWAKMNNITRLRSQSLSIHDKAKIVHLQLQTPVQPSSTIPTTPPNNKGLPEFKTQAHLRRNSYSSGTPYTAQVGLRRIGYGDGNKHILKIHKTQTLEAHNGGVRRMSISSNNIPTFTCDLKKKSKHATESIMKSCEPLKATIPVKNVATMLKTSLPNSEKYKKAKTSLPATPVQAKITSTLCGVGCPKACSTPAAAPLNRITGSVNKPRYSYTSNSNSSMANSGITATFKKRTITESKSRSALKPRGTISSLDTTASPSNGAAGSSRLSVSVGARASKTPALNTSTVKKAIRLNSRSSIGGTLLSAKNKENRRP